jgi:protein SCO1
MRRWFRWIWVLLAGLPLLVAAGMFLGFKDRYRPYGTQVLQSQDFGGVTLRAHTGQLVNLKDYAGVRLIFFGFVSCPDICPTTLLELNKVYQALTPGQRSKVHVFLVTVDPARDTQEILKKYVTAFNPGFVGLTGTPDQIAGVAKKFGVFYQKSAIRSPTSYNVDHTASVFALDSSGKLRTIYNQEKITQTGRVLQDMRWLLGPN